MSEYTPDPWGMQVEVHVDHQLAFSLKALGGGGYEAIQSVRFAPELMVALLTEAMYGVVGLPPRWRVKILAFHEALTELVNEELTGPAPDEGEMN